MTTSAFETPTYDWLDDPAEREWLISVKPEDVRDNAHRIYDFMNETGRPEDSYTRELAFQKAAGALGIGYEVLYNAMLYGRPISRPLAPAPGGPYNGYPSQDAFHAAMREAWAERLSTPEGRAQHQRDYGPGTTSHAGCDHANGYCCQTPSNTF